VSTETLTYDVFLSCSLTEAPVAELIQRALEQAGMDVFSVSKLEAGAGFQESLWRALAESSAVVAIVHPRRTLPSSIAVEVGAAMAWHKPVYVVHTAQGNVRLPGYLGEFPTYPLSRIDDLVQAIARGSKPLSEEEHSVLLSVYADMGIPTDKLLLQPAAIDELARSFNQRCRTHISGERLVQELVRLRKRGALPRLRK
jgi:hypothetical protein